MSINSKEYAKLYAECQIKHKQMEEAYQQWERLDADIRTGRKEKDPNCLQEYQASVKKLFESIKSATNVDLAVPGSLFGNSLQLLGPSDSETIRQIYNRWHDVNEQTLALNKPVH